MSDDCALFVFHNKQVRVVSESPVQVDAVYQPHFFKACFGSRDRIARKPQKLCDALIGRNSSVLVRTLENSHQYALPIDILGRAIGKQIIQPAGVNTRLP